MNVTDFVPNSSGPIGRYLWTSFILTFLSVWVITTFQSRYNFRPGVSFWQRLGWPVFFVLRLFGKDPYAPTMPEEDIDQLLLPEKLLRERQL